ncbi:hypothetical protein TNIN_196551 [Trichonephila inaurata madagascariensis]|uniref:Uncharacterized protein n=1 Tax=Trichonephila inaurata madagascariensis TaxID=2747483 RepID=A0A8X6YH87_9ARAC|nr:hypothetical protein TNIN_196551 [Trichonephila inaurata madagascariensis]
MLYLSGLYWMLGFKSKFAQIFVLIPSSSSGTFEFQACLITKEEKEGNGKVCQNQPRRRALKTWTAIKPENQQSETRPFLPVDGVSQNFSQSVDCTSRNPLGLSNTNLEILCCAARFVEFRNSLMEQTSTRWDMENVP